MELEVIPAIDIKDGKCVRLKQGDFNREKIYGENPVEMAEYWEQKGAKRLHVVDLDGAKEGRPVNLDLIENIVSKLNIPLQLGGGIRSLEIMNKYLERGVDRVITGTLALKSPETVEEAVNKFGTKKIVAGVDAREGKVTVEGWLEESEQQIYEVINDLKERGITTFIYTDISKDGMLEGPDLKGLEELMGIKNINLIASGGISSLEDIKNLSKIGIKQAIVGKALYDGKLNPEQLWD